MNDRIKFPELIRQKKYPEILNSLNISVEDKLLLLEFLIGYREGRHFEIGASGWSSIAYKLGKETSRKKEIVITRKFLSNVLNIIKLDGPVERKINSIL